jgi:hydrogenase-4 component B
MPGRGRKAHIGFPHVIIFEEESMDQFFIALILLACGGVAPLFLWHRLVLMRTFGVAFMAAGCLLGAFDALGRLISGQTWGISFPYLNTFSLVFQMDALASFFLAAIFFIAFLAAIYSFHYLDQAQNALRTAVHYFFFSFLVASMALVVVAANLITFLLAWEIMSLSSFFLVVYHFETAENRLAGYLYFAFSQAGVLFIFAAFGIIYAHTGSFNFKDAAALPETAKVIVFALAFIGFGSKAGVFPLHVWLPHAHPAAPSHISAVMSGVMIKCGIYGILRTYAMLDWHTPIFSYIVLIAGMVSGILGVVYALGQHDLKCLLAYHSVENIGIILIGLGVGMLGVAVGKPVMAVLGFTGGLLHVLNHAIFKSLLFMGAGMVQHKTGTRSIDVLGGLIKKMKITGATFVIASVAIVGLPPLNGFVSEFLIYLGGFQGVAQKKDELAVCLLAIISLAVIGGLALACFTKVVGVIFQGEPRSREARNVNEKGITMVIPIIILAACCVLIGVLPGFCVTLAVKAVGALGLHYVRIPLEPFIAMTANITRAVVLGAAVFALIAVLRFLFYRGKPVARSVTWGCGFTQPNVKMQYTGSSYAASILEFFRPVAPLSEEHTAIRGRFPTVSSYHSHTHDLAERHLVPAVVRFVMWLFDKLRWLQHGDIHLYIGYILLAIAVLLFFV